MTPTLHPDVGGRIDTTAQDLATRGFAQLRDILDPAYAAHLLETAAQVDYAVVTTRESGHVDLPSAWLDSLQPGQRQGLGQAIQTSATTRFQYLFDNHPIYDLAQIGEAAPVWRDLVAFLNGEAFLALMRQITDEPRIAMADAQLTRFRPGHFLTRHDDHAEGKNRHFAYVLNLSPAWIADWGGLLAFHDGEGDLSGAYTPRFNALNLLRTPQPHSVTQVSLFAGADRVSVTGWLRGI